MTLIFDNMVGAKTENRVITDLLHESSGPTQRPGTMCSMSEMSLDEMDLWVTRASYVSLLLEPMWIDNDMESSMSNATGFVVEHDNVHFLVTNRHVMSGWDPVNEEYLMGVAPTHLEIRHNAPGARGSWITTREPLITDSGEALWREHPNGPLIDIAVLPLTELEGVELFTQEVGPPEHDDGTPMDIALYPTQQLSVVGYPFGRRVSGDGPAIWAQAFIASEFDRDFNGQPRFLIDGRTRKGQSGSPVIYTAHGAAVPLRGDVTMAAMSIDSYLLGVYSGRINAESDLGYVWKTSAMLETLSHGVAPKNLS